MLHILWRQDHFRRLHEDFRGFLKIDRRVFEYIVQISVMNKYATKTCKRKITGARMMSSDSAMASNICQTSQQNWKVTKNITFNSIHHILNMWLLLESDKEKNKPMNKNFVKYLPFCESIYKSISSWIHSFHFIFYSLFIHLFKMFLNFRV